MHKPAVGRIVHVTVDAKHNNGSNVAPAVITRVWNDNCVNLRVLHDGPSVPPEGTHRQDWHTSITLHESREARDAAHAELVEKHGAANVAHTPSGAFWPPTV
jgi:hypothetical protein